MCLLSQSLTWRQMGIIESSAPVECQRSLLHGGGEENEKDGGTKEKTYVHTQKWHNTEEDGKR